MISSNNKYLNSYAISLDRDYLELNLYVNTQCLLYVLVFNLIINDI